MTHCIFLYNLHVLCQKNDSTFCSIFFIIKNFFRYTYDRTNVAQRESSQRIGERVSDITFWRSELLQELDRMMAETNRLNDSRRSLEHALKETENPLHVTKECLFFRENRQGRKFFFFSMVTWKGLPPSLCGLLKQTLRGLNDECFCQNDLLLFV